MPHFVATIKVIIEAPDSMSAGKLIREELNDLRKADPGFRLLDWGFIRTGPNTRAYPRILAEPYIIDQSSTQAEREEAFDSI